MATGVPGTDKTSAGVCTPPAASCAGSNRTTVALWWLTTHRRWCESNASPIGPLSEPRVGVITLLAALVPELASAPGAKASSKESSSLATHRLPAASNATPASVARPALGVVTIVAGTRCPVSVSCVGSRRRIPGGLPLTTHSPSCAEVGGGGGGGGGGGWTIGDVAPVPQAPARA